MKRKHHHSSRRKNSQKNKYKSPNFSHNLKWFSIWTLIYFVFYFVFDFLLTELFGNSNFFQVNLIYFLLMGLFFSIFSRIIWCSVHKKRIYLGTDVFFFWTFAFAFSIWFGQFLASLSIEKLGFAFLSKMIIYVLIISIVVSLLIKLIKKIEFGFGRKRRKIKAPQQIITGIVLLVAGILTFRFSYEIFVGWFNWAEGMAWSWLLGLGLIIGGILTLVAWWRNNVSMFTTRHHVKWN